MTLTITTEAHARLKKLKETGDTYSDVLLRDLPDPCETAGELYDRLQGMEVPRAEIRLRQAMLAGRGRRSKRAGRR